MELRLHHIIDHLYNIFLENDGSESCAQFLEEECYKMFGMNSLNIHDANDMQSHKLGDAMFDEDDIFSPQVLMCKFVMMKACLLSLMIMVMTCMLY